MMIQIINEVNIAAKNIGYFRVEWLKTVAPSAVPEHSIQFAQGPGKLNEMASFFFDAIPQRTNFINPLATVINEWTSSHLGVQCCIRVHLRGIDIGIHNFEMAFGNVSGSSGWRD